MIIWYSRPAIFIDMTNFQSEQLITTTKAGIEPVMCKIHYDFLHDITLLPLHSSHNSHELYIELFIIKKQNTFFALTQDWSGLDGSDGYLRVLMALSICLLYIFWNDFSCGVSGALDVIFCNRSNEKINCPVKIIKKKN